MTSVGVAREGGEQGVVVSSNGTTELPLSLGSSLFLFLFSYLFPLISRATTMR